MTVMSKVDHVEVFLTYPALTHCMSTDTPILQIGDQP